jgi:hypothetical protein
MTAFVKERKCAYELVKARVDEKHVRFCKRGLYEGELQDLAFRMNESGILLLL